MAGDRVRVEGFPAIATELPTATASGHTSAVEPKVIYLVYADGTTSFPANGANACSGAVPKFTCSFGTSLLDCEEQIQAYLDQWFADFNVIFTLTRPSSGNYYTAVVSSGGGAWCNVKDTVAGVAPFVCQEVTSGVAFTLDGGSSAHDTAVIIAHEQGHLLGLEHVTDANEIMHPSICQTCTGFEDHPFSVADDGCMRPSQNSYQMMMQALGPWTGGTKPSAFRCVNDSVIPAVSFVSPSNGQRMGHDFTVSVDASDDCGLATVAIKVEPQGLSANTTKGPFVWDLTGIDGNQTITVTATDGAGHSTSAAIDVFAPAGDQIAPAGGATGCTMASGTFSAAGVIPALAMAVVFIGRARRPARSTRRRVPGALSN